MSIHGSIPSFALGTTAIVPQTDKYTDAGFDTQYQYQGDNFWFTLRGSYIREYQNLDASFANGFSANQNNQLSSLRLQTSLALGGDNRFVLTGQYFDIEGTPDPILYGGLASGFSPNSNGWIGRARLYPVRSQARRRGGRGSTRGSRSTTSSTKNSTAPSSVPAATTRCSSASGWPCSRCARTWRGLQ